ncbi:class I SAM-dependent methyltransferase [Rhizobium ruizarguesonis]|jgi:SAM-dependent methyltransferase|uniref:class I SAM-dependent methyltransferase n=1 Tax=Rhizobium ruizarguesonis TaxID=2081791 RepID=UPI0003620EC3|nr:class I SAM-dependent methyltransferase [Rhizobium ruizarguesonis]TAY85889.1 class I SAM-dependent methyltransferase [Rhizobium ruizarguesonis]TAZ70251.1 class I SAM-dependent methyltransferase [Rhizobium ruizarguesonis]TAZ92685.1 class I SAM-dependent methyltransferase [Rhizobium ruizarguesonis]TBA11317.1 class I SAM-dependent methyltransferase [Rhizobium ruizarguesonis]TBA33844.1 class I SAM-dependent methyltransferase [Rhizobium ruizarguesonis]
MTSTKNSALNGTNLYERMGERTTQPFALQLLDELEPLADLSVIDVGAGTGGLAEVASERGASVLAVDLAPAMIERTEERLQKFPRSSAGIMNFLALDIADGIYDVAISNFGILAYPTWQSGLDEMVRVVRPGGSIALTMWTNRDDCSPAHLLHRVFRQHFPNSDLWPPGLFPLFSPASLEEGLLEAGCVDVRAQTAEADWSPFLSVDVVDECDPMFRSFPGYAGLDDIERSNLQKSLKAAFDAYADVGGIIHLPTRAYMVVAKKA